MQENGAKELGTFLRQSEGWNLDKHLLFPLKNKLLLFPSTQVKQPGHSRGGRWEPGASPALSSLPCLSFPHLQMSLITQLPPRGCGAGRATSQGRKKHLVGIGLTPQGWGTPGLNLPLPACLGFSAQSNVQIFHCPWYLTQFKPLLQPPQPG